jgi:pimeloyl-ACP methyl ester carboxylesterase
MSSSAADINSPSITRTAPKARRRFPRGSVLARIALGIVGVVAATAASGAAYEWLSSTGDAKSYPAIGQLIDVGGYRMYLDCRGKGWPTVVMDAGLGGSSLDWNLVQPEVAGTTRVCTFDRAGMGRSEAAVGARNPANLAEELHTLLANAQVPGPYVLVGHSLAGKNARLFAGAYPDEVVGMVLVDARSELLDAQVTEADAEGFGKMLEAQGAMYWFLRHFGLARAFAKEFVGEPLVALDVATAMTLQQTQDADIATTTAEGKARAADDAKLAGVTLGDIPLVVIGSKANMDGMRAWNDSQHQMAALSTQGRLVTADSGHFVQLQQPAVVIEAVSDIVSAVRSGR